MNISANKSAKQDRLNDLIAKTSEEYKNYVRKNPNIRRRGSRTGHTFGFGEGHGSPDTSELPIQETFFMEPKSTPTPKPKTKATDDNVINIEQLKNQIIGKFNLKLFLAIMLSLLVRHFVLLYSKDETKTDVLTTINSAGLLYFLTINVQTLCGLVIRFMAYMDGKKITDFDKIKYMSTHMRF